MDPSFQEVNRLFVLSSEDNAVTAPPHRRLSSEIRNKIFKFYDQWKKLFDQPVNNDPRTYANFPGFQEHYGMRAKDLNKQLTVDDDPKEIEQINLTGNLNQAAAIFFIIKESK